MVKAELKSVKVAGVPAKGSEIVAVNYDARILRVTVYFPESPDTEFVYLDFEFPRGFRVLEEGDLFEFWGTPVAAESFLFEVGAGGWLDQEAKRPGFIHTPGLKEYLVAGTTDCISVMTGGSLRTHVCK